MSDAEQQYAHAAELRGLAEEYLRDARATYEAATAERQEGHVKLESARQLYNESAMNLNLAIALNEKSKRRMQVARTLLWVTALLLILHWTT